MQDSKAGFLGVSLGRKIFGRCLDLVGVFKGLIIGNSAGLMLEKAVLWSTRSLGLFIGLLAISVSKRGIFKVNDVF